MKVILVKVRYCLSLTSHGYDRTGTRSRLSCHGVSHPRSHKLLVRLCDCHRYHWGFRNGVETLQRDCVARLEGFEPPTAWFVARYSIQLSYRRTSPNSKPSRLTLHSRCRHLRSSLQARGDRRSSSARRPATPSGALPWLQSGVQWPMHRHSR